MRADHDPKQCLRRFRRSGDPIWIERLFEATAPALWRLALRLARDPAEADDLLQSTYAAVIESHERFDDRRPVEAWMVGILTNKAHELRRRGARNVVSSEVEAAGDAPGPEREAQTEEERALVREAVSELPPRYREVIELVLDGGLRPAEIAARLDRTPGAVRVQIHRALEMLRKAMPAGLALPAALLTLRAIGLEDLRARVTELARVHGTKAQLAGSGIGASKGLGLVLGLGLVAGVGVWQLLPVSRPNGAGGSASELARPQVARSAQTEQGTGARGASTAPEPEDTARTPDPEAGTAVVAGGQATAGTASEWEALVPEGMGLRLSDGEVVGRGEADLWFRSLPGGIALRTPPGTGARSLSSIAAGGNAGLDAEHAASESSALAEPPRRSFPDGPASDLSRQVASAAPWLLSLVSFEETLVDASPSGSEIELREDDPTARVFVLRDRQLWSVVAVQNAYRDKKDRLVFHVLGRSNSDGPVLRAAEALRTVEGLEGLQFALEPTAQDPYAEALYEATNGFEKLLDMRAKVLGHGACALAALPAAQRITTFVWDEGVSSFSFAAGGRLGWQRLDHEPDLTLSGEHPELSLRATSTPAFLFRTFPRRNAPMEGPLDQASATVGQFYAWESHVPGVLAESGRSVASLDLTICSVTKDGIVFLVTPARTDRPVADAAGEKRLSTGELLFQWSGFERERKTPLGGSPYASDVVFSFAGSHFGHVDEARGPLHPSPFDLQTGRGFPAVHSLSGFVPPKARFHLQRLEAAVLPADRETPVRVRLTVPGSDPIELPPTDGRLVTWDGLLTLEPGQMRHSLLEAPGALAGEVRAYGWLERDS